MKKIEQDTEPTTSKAASAAGLRRIQRKHIARPGEVTLADCKVRVILEVDADILEHFKAQAAQPNAPSYEDQINQALRAAIESEQHNDLSTKISSKPKSPRKKRTARSAKSFE